MRVLWSRIGLLLSPSLGAGKSDSSRAHLAAITTTFGRCRSIPLMAASTKAWQRFSFLRLEMATEESGGQSGMATDTPPLVPSRPSAVASSGASIPMCESPQITKSVARTSLFQRQTEKGSIQSRS